MKKLLCFLMCGFVSCSLIGCSSSNEKLKEEVKEEAKVSAEEKKKEEEKKNVVDDAFMDALATGLEKRWENTGDKSRLVIDESWEKYPSLELEEIEGFENQEFNDPELKELAVEYINHLRKQKSIPSGAANDLANTGFAWSATGTERCRLITLFNEKYGLTVDEKYADSLDSMVEGYHDPYYDVLGIYDELHIEEFNDNGGVLHYKLSGVNNTNTTFNNIGFQLQVEDKEGAILGQVYSTTIATMAPGQKFTVDIYGTGAEQFPPLKDTYIYVSSYYD